MSNLKHSSNELLVSIEKFKLNYLIIEVRLHIITLEEKCHIHEYFLEKTLQNKPLKIFKSKYKNWENTFNALENTYQNTFQTYIEECQYFDELVQLLNEISSE